MPSKQFTHRNAAFFCTQFDKRLISKLLFSFLLLPSFSAFSAPLAPKLGEYIDQAMANNPGLKQNNFELESQLAQLRNLRGRYWPTLGLSARYSVSEGGRTIDFPAGDLLNPVYRALNAQAVANGQPASFPTVQNQSIPLLRPTEQDTRLTLKGPIYSPELNAQVKSQNALVVAQTAQREAYKETLIRDLKVAYWQVAQLKGKVDVLQTSLNTLKENERVNKALYASGAVTLDEPKRATAERLDVQVQLDQAQTDLSTAEQYFNILRAVNENAPIETPDATTLTGQTSSLIESLQPTNTHQKPSSTLDQLQANQAALQAQTEAAQAAYKPSLGYAVEGGYQGPDYSTGPHTGFATASVVLSWSLFDGGIRQSAVDRAKAKAQALAAQTEDITRKLRLARSKAKAQLLVSLKSIEAREGQQAAANESLRINQKKRDAGQATQIEFLSAEQAATRARIGLITAIYQAQIDYAQWEFSNTALPLPEGQHAGDTP